MNTCWCSQRLVPILKSKLLFFFKFISDRIQWTFHTNYYIASILYFAWMWKKCHIYQSNKRKRRKKCRLNDAWQLALIIKHFETERESHIQSSMEIGRSVLKLNEIWIPFNCRLQNACRRQNKNKNNSNLLIQSNVALTVRHHHHQQQFNNKKNRKRNSTTSSGKIKNQKRRKNRKESQKCEPTIGRETARQR